MRKIFNTFGTIKVEGDGFFFHKCPSFFFARYHNEDDVRLAVAMFLQHPALRGHQPLEFSEMEKLFTVVDDGVLHWKRQCLLSLTRRNPLNLYKTAAKYACTFLKLKFIESMNGMSTRERIKQRQRASCIRVYRTMLVVYALHITFIYIFHDAKM